MSTDTLKEIDPLVVYGTYRIGLHYLSYLINGEASGLGDEELAQLDAWLENFPKGPKIWDNPENESFFATDAVTGLHADVAEVDLYMHQSAASVVKDPADLLDNLRSTITQFLLLPAAKLHGERSGLEREVRDLQEMVSYLVKQVLTPGQLASFLSAQSGIASFLASETDERLLASVRARLDKAVTQEEPVEADDNVRLTPS